MLERDLYKVINPITSDLGYILWGIEIVSNVRPMNITVFIDHENGISVDDCQIVSKELSTIFDVENIFLVQYVLEVSSPGLNRRIFNINQAKDLIGCRVKAFVIDPIRSHIKFKGIIKGVLENYVTLELDNKEEKSFNFDDFKKLRISQDLD